LLWQNSVAPDAVADLAPSGAQLPPGALPPAVAVVVGEIGEVGVPGGPDGPDVEPPAVVGLEDDVGVRPPTVV
jgi:hypothetical protein